MPRLSLQQSCPLDSPCMRLIRICWAPENVPVAQICRQCVELIVLVTRGISALEYAQRRSKLASKLPRNSIAVLAAADLKYRSGVVFYEYHQESNFFYLTGFNEPEALAIIGKSEHEDDHVFHLYVRPKDPKAEIWDGARSGLDAATDVFNADYTGDINDLRKILPPILSGASEIYTDISTKSTSTSFFARFFSTSNTGFAKIIGSRTVKPLQHIINDLRAYKSDAEIRNMRKAGQISGRAFTMTLKRRWSTEKALADYLEYNFKAKGCDGSAYVPVVASGKNALSIHYTRNDALLDERDLVLVDAGGEYGHYITDITRTWPLARRFSPAQRDLYSAILSVQRKCVSLCRANANVSLDTLHRMAENDLRENLVGLGFDMSGKALETLFPHHLGHHIGLDVHDCPGYPRDRPLHAGQCVTIEPGLYVPDDGRWPKHFRDMGIRIEDSIAVQEEHPLILTTEAVKEIDDVEAVLHAVDGVDDRACDMT